MEKKFKHLEMIQNIINRMANNSFMLKGWAVTLIAGIFALSSNDTDKQYTIIAYIPIIIFWGLDSYYLLQERLYRSLYDKVRLVDENQIDFSLNTNVNELQNNKNRYINCLVSKTEFWFYFPLILVCTVVILFTIY